MIILAEGFPITESFASATNHYRQIGGLSLLASFVAVELEIRSVGDIQFLVLGM